MTMTAYAVANLRNVTMGPAIIAYLQAIDATLAPFDGRFIIHGGDKTVLEGQWPGDLIVIAFPEREAAEQWYASQPYRDIQHLRADNSESDVILIAGVGEEHRATDILAGPDAR
jgi:uncharacterized protein (DUF1330 family)